MALASQTKGKTCLALSRATPEWIGINVYDLKSLHLTSNFTPASNARGTRACNFGILESHDAPIVRLSQR